ncbi:MAG: hypothetical protein NZ920_01175 [Aigarchaeota archaeon]|nr:hypothetical protein [Aigarchaeota archaeon]MDW8093053.1 hypothetical protein [Nitrososphaerota archaeon]
MTSGEKLSKEEERVTLTVEVTLPGGLKISASGTSPESVVERLKESIKLAGSIIPEGIATERPPSTTEKKMPPQILSSLQNMSKKELVLLLLHHESPLSRDQINQRSRELGREVSKEWLDTEFYRRPFKEYFVVEEGADGNRLYRLSELGKMEAQRILSKYLNENP